MAVVKNKYAELQLMGHRVPFLSYLIEQLSAAWLQLILTCNTLYVKLLMKNVQKVQSAGAKLLIIARLWDHTMPVLETLSLVIIAIGTT